MFSYRRLRNRKSPLPTLGKQWIMDSGGFSELHLFGKYTFNVDQYLLGILRFKPTFFCSMDWTCEPSSLKATGKSLLEHLTLSTQSHIVLRESVEKKNLLDRLMGCIQGYHADDYLLHIDMLREHGLLEDYMGIGTLCRRQKTAEIIPILRQIKQNLPSRVKLHGFGIKTTTLRNPAIYGLLNSCDSMSWSRQAREESKRGVRPCLGQACCVWNTPDVCRSRADDCANCPIFMREWTKQIEETILETSQQSLIPIEDVC